MIYNSIKFAFYPYPLMTPDIPARGRAATVVVACASRVFRIKMHGETSYNHFKTCG